jgi:uncharacterized protein YjdB
VASFTVNAAPVLQILSLTPSTQQALTVGSKLQISVTGGYSDGSTQNLTNVATWTTSDPTVATVHAGLVTAVGSGHASIYAAYGGASPANLLVTVPQGDE